MQQHQPPPAEEVTFQSGDIVKLVGGASKLVVVTKSKHLVYCAPLPYKVGEPVIAVPETDLCRAVADDEDIGAEV